MLLECFSYESRKSFLPWILPTFSPRTFEFPSEKEEEESAVLHFPGCPLLILNDLWIKRKERSSMLFFGCLGGCDWRLGSHEKEKSFFLVGNFACESLLHEASCSFMSFPSGMCLLGGTSHSCLSLVWRCPLRFSADGGSLCLQDGLGGRRSPRGLDLVRNPLRCCLCLCWQVWWVPWVGSLTFHPLGLTFSLQIGAGLRLLWLFYEAECQESAGFPVARFELLEL